MSLPESHPDIDVILDILGVCLLADKYERDEELVEFCNSAQLLGRFIAPEIVLSRQELRQWLESNKTRLCAVVGDVEAERAMLERVTDPELRRKTLVAIFAICVCDYHLADEESAFLSLAMEVWKPKAMTPDMLEVLD